MLTIHGTYAQSESGAALLPGVWYDLNGSGQMFKLYAPGAWLNAVADFCVLTEDVNWDCLIPPFTQEHITSAGLLVTLHVGEQDIYITITQADDA